MSESSIQEGPKDTRHTSVKLLKDSRDKLAALKKELGFATYSAFFSFVILELGRERMAPPPSAEIVLKDTIPAFISGESGSGKTTAAKSLLKEWPGSVFVLDPHNEYEDYRKVDLGRFFGVDWEKDSLRIRFVPNEKVEVSKTEASLIFSHLNMVRQSGALKNWILCIEEAHRFKDDPNLRTLLNEARKFTRKLVVVTADVESFKGIAKVFKPVLWTINQGYQC